ncbi:MAG: DUF4381 family protein [Verrucomicrobiota bacterium]
MKTNSAALVVPPPSPVSPTEGLRDIKAPVEIPNTWAWVWWTIGLLALGVLLFWAWRYWRKTRAQKLTGEKIIPPDERARKKLRDALAFIDQPKPFCTLVSDTIRTYLEERFELRAPERTTEEFLFELQSSTALLPSQKETLGDFLARCDLVKFARFEPVQSELQELHHCAERLVNETEPPAPLAPGAHGEGPDQAKSDSVSVSK